MENVTQETIDKMVNNWGTAKTTFEKLDSLIDDMNNCKSDYTKTILYSAALKLADSIGLKDKLTA